MNNRDMDEVITGSDGADSEEGEKHITPVLAPGDTTGKDSVWTIQLGINSSGAVTKTREVEGEVEQMTERESWTVALDDCMERLNTAEKNM